MPVAWSRATTGRPPRALERSGRSPPKREPIMSVDGPHFLLFAEASAGVGSRPQWKFILQSVGGHDRLSATEAEAESRSSRLELLAVVRGLEALDQPSRVTLLTRSRYVSRGLRRGLSQWRDRRWRWERFGQLVPIRDHDLWQRVDRALAFHKVECCNWEGDEALSSGANVRATTAEAVSPEPAQSLVRHRNPLRRWWLTGTLGRLRQGILTPFSAIWPPAFTRAA
jgi:ribonuclease HI